MYLFQKIEEKLFGTARICSIYKFYYLGGDKLVGGHTFKDHNFTARWCDVCGRFLWGLVRQGLKCKGEEGVWWEGRGCVGGSCGD